MTTDDSHKPLTTSEFIALRDRIAAKGSKGITEDERTELLKRTKNGERLARELFVLLHERLVGLAVSKDKRRRRKVFHVDDPEAMQEGRLAILRAAETFDPTKSRFSTWLFWHLRSCNRYDNSGDPMVWMGRAKFFRSVKIEGGEIAALRDLACLDEPIDGEESSSLSDMIGSEGPTPEDLFAEMQVGSEVQSTIRAALATLSDRERFVIESRFSDDDPSLADLAQVLNISRERVRQIEEAALEKLRRRMGSLRIDSASSRT